MKINLRKSGIIGAVTGLSIYLVFILIVKLRPSMILNLLSATNQVKVSNFFMTLTPGALVVGCLTHAIVGFFVFWLIAKIYNSQQKNT
ncbi:MAG TPA: DUF5676 family membrane protein [Candidatus Babeliales bacterium]|nr:DUF5676 family membrane protein [Candidatus Babeliales bacterium]